MHFRKILIFVQVIGQSGPQNINYSIYGHTFFGHNSAIFLSNWAENCLYYLSISYDFFEKILFLAGKMMRQDSRGPGPQDWGV